MQGVEDTPRQEEQMVQMTREEFRRLMEETGKSALVAYERRTATPLAKDVTRRRLFKEKEIEEDCKR
ncbi:UNVERIFIED_CONTAM: hypothetical protein Slati_4238600 [Sesamum latifolium]|uniref:Uncharacterized protein n=1 Tax=Sesamum latifolium TaxID=2727402 RepID=A0AAW2TC52_9LAMI